MRGVYGAGGVTALERAGLNEGFTAAFGTSSGAPTIAYFLAGQAAMGSSMFWEECVSGYFLDWKRLRTNVSYLADVWRGKIGHKKLDTFAISEHPTRSYVSAIDVLNGESNLIRLTERIDIVEALVASCAMPGVYRDLSCIGEKCFIDGTIENPYPAERLFAIEKPSSVLVFANRSRSYQNNSWILKVYDFLVKYVFQYHFHISVAEREKRLAEALVYLRESGIPYCIIYADSKVDSFSRNPRKLKAAAARFQDFVADLIQKAHM
jgi:predicted patatin/cPLA2 family phospholipase